jgi:hypothetical protein
MVSQTSRVEQIFSRQPTQQQEQQPTTSTTLQRKLRLLAKKICVLTKSNPINPKSTEHGGTSGSDTLVHRGGGFCEVSRGSRIARKIAREYSVWFVLWNGQSLETWIDSLRCLCCVILEMTSSNNHFFFQRLHTGLRSASQPHSGGCHGDSNYNRNWWRNRRRNCQETNKNGQNALCSWGYCSLGVASAKDWLK